MALVTLAMRLHNQSKNPLPQPLYHEPILTTKLINLLHLENIEQFNNELEGSVKKIVRFAKESRIRLYVQKDKELTLTPKLSNETHTVVLAKLLSLISESCQYQDKTLTAEEAALIKEGLGGSEISLYAKNLIKKLTVSRESLKTPRYALELYSFALNYFYDVEHQRLFERLALLRDGMFEAIKKWDDM